MSMRLWREGLLLSIGVVAWVAGQCDFAGAALPRPDHVVVVIEENHSYSELLGSSSPATWLKSLASAGASFTQSFAIEHPSQPNYLDLFSGANQGTTGTDNFPGNTPFSAANLGAQIRAAGFSFAGYSESLPSAGSLVATNPVGGKNGYVHKHNPWANWQVNSPTGNQLPPSTNQPFTAFPTNFSTLPTLSFVIPNEQDDMHDGTITAGDTWCKNNIDAYYQWAKSHNSLLIVTTDEDDSSQSNQITTIFAGQMVLPGQYSQTINHYNVLATLEDMYGLSRIAGAVGKTAISSSDFVVPEPIGMSGIVWVGLVLMRARTRQRRTRFE